MIDGKMTVHSIRARRTAPRLLALAAGLSLGLQADSNPPPPARTGAPADGGQDCSACHRGAGANSDPRGSLLIQAANFKPGIRQTLRIILSHPEARRWGFQLTARIVNDETRQAGTFGAGGEISLRCAPDGRAAPCQGAPEFASHNAGSTRENQAGPVSWEIEWTPPSDDVGDVVFYAAGLAANNDRTSRGDWTYTAALRVENEGSCPQTPRRAAIRSVVNGATFLPETGISLNSMISLFGLGFADAGVQRVAGRGDLREGRFPLRLACVGVEVAGKRVPVTFVKTDQINAQAPTLDLNGPVEVRVILNPGFPNEVRSDPATVRMQPLSPAFFLFAGTRSIAAQHADYAYLAEPAVVPGAMPARPGETVILYGTGFGATDPVYQAGEIPAAAAPLRQPIVVTIGGVMLRPEEILYAGLSPGSISGLYQFNLRIPDSVGEGNLPVEIRVGGASTQSGATIPVRR